MRKTIVTGLVCLISACAVSKVDPLTVPLAYQAPAKPPLAVSTASCAVSLIQVDDRRADKSLGIRFHETKPLKADVTAANDPASWVREGMQVYLTRNGLTQAKGSRLLVELRGLKTEETIWHRSSYEAKIALTARLQSSSGKACGEQSVEGKAGNYGYAGSIENYQETLNSALDDATQRLMDSPLFGSCQCT